MTATGIGQTYAMSAMSAMSAVTGGKPLPLGRPIVH